MRISYLCLAVLGAASMSGQSLYSISTVAGQLPDPEGKLATEAILVGLGPIAVAPDGALHMSGSREGRSVLYTIDAETGIRARAAGPMECGAAADDQGKVRLETPQRFGPFQP
jgi:hypothetical protein